MGSNIGLKIAGIAGVVAVIGGGCVAAYSFSDTVKNQVKLAFSSPDDYFNWVYEKNTTDLADNCEESMQKALDKKDQGTSGSFTLSLEPTGDIKDYLIDDLGIDDTSSEEKELINLIQSTDSLAIGADSIVRSNSTSQHLTFLRNGEQIVSADIIADLGSKKCFGRVPELTERWFSVDLADLHMDELDAAELTVNPDTLPTAKEVADAVHKYGMMMVQNVSSVTVEKKQPVQISGISTEYTAVTSPMTLNQLLDTLQNVIDNATVDETLKKLIPNSADYQNAMLEAGDALRSVRESGYDLSQTINLVTYVDATGTIRGIFVTVGSDLSFFTAVGMDGNNLAAELKLSAGGQKLLACKADAVRSGDSASGTATFSVNSYGDEMTTATVEFTDFRIVDTEKGFVSGDMKISVDEEDFPTIALTFSSDGSSQTITYPLTVEDISIGNLALTYSVNDGGDVAIPSDNDSYRYNPDDSDFEITDYVDGDSIKKFAKDTMAKLGLSDELIEEADEALSYAF